MKTFLRPLLLVLFVFLLICPNRPSFADNAGKPSEVKPEKTVEVYFFHRNRRCGPCNAIEANTKKLIETQYKERVITGSVKLNIINVDQPDNQEIARKFNARSTGLFVVEKNGEEEIINNLTVMAMRHGRNEEAFCGELQKVIEDCLSR